MEKTFARMTGLICGGVALFAASAQAAGPLLAYTECGKALTDPHSAGKEESQYQVSFTHALIIQNGEVPTAHYSVTEKNGSLVPNGFSVKIERYLPFYTKEEIRQNGRGSADTLRQETIFAVTFTIEAPGRILFWANQGDYQDPRDAITVDLFCSLIVEKNMEVVSPPSLPANP